MFPFQTLDSDYSKNEEGLLGVLCHILSVKSLELILSAAAATGKLRNFATKLIKSVSSQLVFFLNLNYGCYAPHLQYVKSKATMIKARWHLSKCHNVSENVICSKESINLTNLISSFVTISYFVSHGKRYSSILGIHHGCAI